MRRKLLIAVLLAAVFAPSAVAGRVTLTPGVTYERQLVFTPHGPEVIHVMTAPRPGGLYALRPMLSNDTVLGRETVTSMQRRASATATVGGVNADLFTWDEGLPSGMYMQSGVLKTPPHPRRSTVGITDDGRLLVQRVQMLGTWQGSSQRRPLGGLNQRPGPQGLSVFTPAWGPATPAAQGTVEVTLDPFPPAAPATDLTGTVVAVKPAGGTPIPPGGAVLVARGTSSGRLASEAQVGQTVTVRLILRPQWGGVVDAVGGGPLIVRDGQPVFRALESFTSNQLSLRNPRTAVGQRTDGRIILVAVDGRQPGYSTGLTNFELAQTMVRLGAMTASALDAGGSTTMAFDGQLLNRPSDPGGERQVADGLFVFYYGVHAPPPSRPVLSPNGDGVAETQSLSYKIVRPSTVTASLVGPDRIPRETQTGPREPGTYRLTWSGRTPEGTPETEGRWRWVINAVDDQAQQSTVERSFALNNTLGYLNVRPSRVVVHRRGGNLRVGFRLAHSALVTVTIETASGARVRTIRRRRGPGQMSIRWNGRYGNGVRAFSGPYVARVQTSNSFGRAELKRRFSVRRARR
ncbi:MAG TPA: phosphodiester glycosidase family protein [Gaiellaceae bacterium]|nr:phosphodiester glycosidase family protein [Gaiellaceae bacterium]